jgi:hypothetical protein
MDTPLKQLNVFSQNGEDGLILRILDLMNLPPQRRKFCVEFGAWDGLHFSNTANLIINHGFEALLIESHKDRFLTLSRNFPQENIKKVNAFVGLNKNDNIENYLSAAGAPIDFDLLSIDIDGCDYYILETIKHFKPKIICIEYNPTIPQDIEFVQEKNFSTSHGSSSKSIIKLAEKMGYRFVVNTETNLLFVDKMFAEKLFTNDSGFNGHFYAFRDSVYIFSGYDGSILLSSKLELPWHQLKIEIKYIQVLPKILRYFPDKYNIWKKILFNYYTQIKKFN